MCWPHRRHISGAKDSEGEEVCRWEMHSILQSIQTMPIGYEIRTMRRTQVGVSMQTYELNETPFPSAFSIDICSRCVDG